MIKRRGKISGCAWIAGILILLFLATGELGFFFGMSLLVMAGFALIWPFGVCLDLPAWNVPWMVFIVTWLIVRVAMWRERTIKTIALPYALVAAITFIILIPSFSLLRSGAYGSAEASRIINDTRNMKAASLMWYIENNDKWSFQSAEDLTSLDFYLDRPVIGIRYRVVTVAVEKRGSMIGMAPLEENLLVGNDAKGVRGKLAERAPRNGVLDANGRVYKGKDAFVFIVETGHW